MKENNHNFRHIAVNTSQYRQSFFPKTVGPWNQLSFADSPTLENFRINVLSTNRPKRYAHLSEEIAKANTLDPFKSKLAH